MTNELWRVHYGIRSGGLSFGETKFYENGDRLREDLLEAELSMRGGSEAPSGTSKTGRRLAQRWLRWVRRYANEKDQRRHIKIQRIDRRDGDDWTPYVVLFTEPKVALMEESEEEPF